MANSKILIHCSAMSEAISVLSGTGTSAVCKKRESGIGHCLRVTVSDSLKVRRFYLDSFALDRSWVQSVSHNEFSVHAT